MVRTYAEAAHGGRWSPSMGRGVLIRQDVIYGLNHPKAKAPRIRSQSCSVQDPKAMAVSLESVG